MGQTHKKIHLVEKIEDVKKLLVENQGTDEISLEIASSGRIFMLDWPMLKVGITADLLHHLQVILGDSGTMRIDKE